MAVSVVLIRVLVEACELAGVSREQLLNAAAFDAGRLDDNDGRVSLTEYEGVQLAALDLTRDEALGLHIGDQAHFAGFDVMASLIAHAATLRDGLQAYSRFHRILSDVPDTTLSESSRSATLRHEAAGANARCNRLRAELALAGLMRLIRYVAGAEATVDRVCFEHAAPGHAAEYTRIFGRAVVFEEPFTAIEFDRALLDRAPLHRDPELYAALESQASRKLSRLEGARSVKTRVVDYLMARSLRNRPDMAEVAQHLGMSVRSLRRRLSVEGVTYAEAFDEALASVAKSMLRDPEQSIVGAAYAMGFSDSSAFHRAFKRWTGITPNQYRQQ